MLRGIGWRNLHLQIRLGMITVVGSTSRISMTYTSGKHVLLRQKRLGACFESSPALTGTGCSPSKFVTIIDNLFTFSDKRKTYCTVITSKSRLIQTNSSYR